MGQKTNQPLHGKKIALRQFNGLCLDEVEYSSNFKIDKHSHDFPLFYLVQRGSFTQFHGSKNLECEPWTLAFIPPHQVHSAQIHSGGARCFIIEFKESWLERFEAHSLLQDTVDFKSSSSVSIVSRLYQEFRQKDDFSALAIEGLTLELIAETSRNQVRLLEQKRPDWLKQVEEILRCGFSNQLMLIDIARLVDIHPMHLARVFRQYYHCTIGEYIRRLRVEFACHQIKTTDFGLLKIALDAGFYDQSHFSRSFKQITGLTPTEYKANLRFC